MPCGGRQGSQGSKYSQGRVGSYGSRGSKAGRGKMAGKVKATIHVLFCPWCYKPFPFVIFILWFCISSLVCRVSLMGEQVNCKVFH
jgi:hypothetical protein